MTIHLDGSGSEDIGRDALTSNEYKTLRGFLRFGIPDSWQGTPYRVYTFSNFYQPSTFTLVFRND